MLKPPFRLAGATNLTDANAVDSAVHLFVTCCDGDDRPPEVGASSARLRLTDMPQHLHCSVIGTCLSTAELRKLMGRFLFVRDSSDLEVHHEAVSHAAQGGPVAKALQKLLDQRHEVALQRFGRVRAPVEIASLWEEALKQGEIPGAYWAVLTHRHATEELRQRVFGDVHMLSHLVGAANRADIRRLVAMELQNDALRERVEQLQLRLQEMIEERQRTESGLEQELATARSARASVGSSTEAELLAATRELESAMSLVAVQTERRERAEQAASVSAEEAGRLRDEVEHLGRHAHTLNRELLAAETQLREIGEGSDVPGRTLTSHLQGRRVFYVGGRPSSTPAIRALVLRHGGEFQHHDGGLEDRKGLLAAGVAGAQLVVFPVDCVDHDSAGNLKRLCARHGVAYLPLRRASVASLAAALSDSPAADAGSTDSSRCRRS